MNNEKIWAYHFRDQEAISEYQRELKADLLEQKRAQKAYLDETAQQLGRLIENNRQVFMSSDHLRIVLLR